MAEFEELCRIAQNLLSVCELVLVWVGAVFGQSVLRQLLRRTLPFIDGLVNL
jgi:hypothetical protein